VDLISARDEVYARGPVAAAIDSTQRRFRLYSSEIYDEPDCRNDWSNDARSGTAWRDCRHTIGRTGIYQDESQ
jgi:hypothetical protein